MKTLLSNEFGQKEPKGFQDITPDEWARYAFANNKEYIITYYKEEAPCITMSHTTLSIRLSYYENKEDKLFRYMNIIFNKGYIEYSSKNTPCISYDNGRIFLGQIDKIGNLGSTLVFYSHKKKNNVRLDEFIREDGVVKEVKQFGTADLNKLWFQAPKHYLEYEHLLDYKKQFEVLS